MRRSALSIGLAALIAVCALTAYYVSFHDVLLALAETVYPGQRVEDGGGLSRLHFLSGFFAVLLLDAKPVPAVLTNQSEAASALFLFPFLTPSAAYAAAQIYRRHGKLDYVLLALIGYVALLSLWMLVGLPRPLERLLLLDRVPVSRAVIGLVVANVILAFYWLSLDVDTRDARARTLAAIGTTGSLVIYAAVAVVLKRDHPTFAESDWTLGLLVAAAGALTAALLARGPAAFAAGFLLFSLVSSATVNPLYRGLDPVLDTPFLAELAAIREADPTARWVAYDTTILGNYLLAGGFPVLSSVQVYQQEQLWLQFDPGRRYEDAWNRYAHVWFTVPPDPRTIALTSHDIDTFGVVVHPCHPLLADLDVRFLSCRRRSPRRAWNG